MPTLIKIAKTQRISTKFLLFQFPLVYRYQIKCKIKRIQKTDGLTCQSAERAGASLNRG